MPGPGTRVSLRDAIGGRRATLGPTVMSSDAVVGVVIPTLNGQRYLSEAIESVLGQTHQALDVVVVDDGSSDATGEVARGYDPEVRFLPLGHQGLGSARNAGLRAVRGDYVSFLDQDDVWPPQKLEVQLAAFGLPMSPDLVFGAAREFISPELEPSFATHFRCVEEPRPAALPGAMLAKRASVARVGPFSTRWTGTDFMAWLLCARQLGLVEVMLGDHVLSRRLHATNYSHRAEEARAEYLSVIRESLDRRRARRRSAAAERADPAALSGLENLSALGPSAL
jgi:glycosyltransferase involved in cell wall biosynthesis